MSTELAESVGKDTKYQIFLHQNSMMASTGRNCAIHNNSFQAATFLNWIYSLDQYFPTQLSPNTEIVTICTVQYGSHLLHVDIRALEICLVPLRNRISNFLNFNLNVNCHMWLLVTILHSTGLDSVCAKTGKLNIVSTSQ